MAIGNAIQKGSTVYVYNEKNMQIFSQTGTLLGYTNNTINIQRGNAVYTYDANGRQISARGI